MPAAPWTPALSSEAAPGLATKLPPGGRENGSPWDGRAGAPPPTRTHPLLRLQCRRPLRSLVLLLSVQKEGRNRVVTGGLRARGLVSSSPHRQPTRWRGSRRSHSRPCPRVLTRLRRTSPPLPVSQSPHGAGGGGRAPRDMTWQGHECTVTTPTQHTPQTQHTPAHNTHTACVHHTHPHHTHHTPTPHMHTYTTHTQHAHYMHATHNMHTCTHYTHTQHTSTTLHAYMYTHHTPTPHLQT